MAQHNLVVYSGNFWGNLGKNSDSLKLLVSGNGLFRGKCKPYARNYVMSLNFGNFFPRNFMANRSLLFTLVQKEQDLGRTSVLLKVRFVSYFMKMLHVDPNFPIAIPWNNFFTKTKLVINFTFFGKVGCKNFSSISIFYSIRIQRIDTSI